MKPAAVIVLVLLPSCHGIRAGFFGGVLEQRTQLDDPFSVVAADASGPFYGAFASFQLTPDMPPERFGGSVILNRPDPDPIDPYAQPDAVAPTFDPAGPYAIATYIATALAIVVKAMGGRKD